MAAMVQGSGEGVPLTLDSVDTEKNDTKKRRFLWGLRRLRLFRRKGARSEPEVRETSGTPGPPTLRGRSSDHLLTDDESPKRKRQQSGLSVSHDSVFTAEASGADSDEDRTRSHPRQLPAVSAELAAAVRRRARGDTSEEDEDLGLPRSPSPHKRGPGRSRVTQSGAEQSSCSEGSLLSAGSSDPDDEFRSSRGDLDSIPPTTVPSVSSIADSSDHDAEEPPSGLLPLSHLAARHKMEVRPRKTHGPPRRIRPNQMSPSTTLPTTPEVNEEVTRSTTPEVISVGKTETTTSMTSNTRQIITTSTTSHHHYQKMEVLSQSSEISIAADENHSSQVPKETRLKSSSLPSGLALSQMIGQTGASPIKFSLSSNDELANQSNKVARSKSNAQKKECDNLMLSEQQQSVSERNILHHHSKTVHAEKKFDCVSEDEELLKSETKTNKYRKNNEKIDKEPHYVNIVHSHKSKNIKEVEEVHEKHISKKEESFFGRLLLRKSGKKNKKENQNEKDDVDSKKTQTQTQMYKSLNTESYSVNQGMMRHQKVTCSEQIHKSIGQKVFSNQNHKRIDSKGGYVNDPMQQDLKHFAEREKIEIQTKSNPLPKSRQRVDPHDIPIGTEIGKKPAVTPRTSLESKSFFPIINQSKVYPSHETINGSRFIKNTNGSKYDEYHSHGISPKFKVNPEVFNFNSQNMHLSSLAYEVNTKPLSYSVSPPRSVWPQKSDASNVKSSSQGSLDHHSFEPKLKIAGLSSYQQKVVGSQIEPDSFISYSENPRNPVVKSHSFRHNSDTSSINASQDMPSLPPTFGISESSMDSWESTYRKNLKESLEAPTSLELGSDSLLNYPHKTPVPNTVFPDRNVFIIPNIEGLNKNAKENIDLNVFDRDLKPNVRDNDISRIEANIDSIIGSPKPLNCIALKSNSLDSVKSLSEKSPEPNRKAISNESISHSKVYINQPGIPDMVGSVSFNQKLNSSPLQSPKQSEAFESHVSVTVLNSSMPNKTPESDHNIPDKSKIKESKSPEVQTVDSSVPEFMKIQLNKVDQKPSNVVLTTGAKTPTKDTNHEIKVDKVEKSVNVELRKSEPIEVKDIVKPQRKFSSEDVEILEKSDVNNLNNNTFNVALRKNGSQSLLNRSTEMLNSDNKNQTEKLSVPNVNYRKSTPVSSLPPVSPTAPKNFVRKKSEIESDSLKRHSGWNLDDQSNRSSQELSEQTMRSDRSSSSSDDTNLDSTVVFRKKSLASSRNNNKKDDEPELMKVFARRSLKLKDVESEAIAQDILLISNLENEDGEESKRKSKHFNVMTKSRDSDKENEVDSPKEERKKISLDTDSSKVKNNKKLLDSNPITASTRHSASFIVNNYQRSISANIPLLPHSKTETKTEFKKDVSDNTPEKRIRNRTFPDSNNDNKEETPTPVNTSSLTKRIWSTIKSESENNTLNKESRTPFRKSSFVSMSEKQQPKEKQVIDAKESEKSTDANISADSDNGGTEGETDGSPQFKGILQMRAEWERRAQQAMTK